MKSDTSFDPYRAVRDLRTLAERTGGPDGSRRLCWTPEWVEARALLREELSTLAVEVEQDEAGNIWAYLRGQSDELVVVGSHLDSVPAGGWLDGALGVIGGLEVLRSLAAAPQRPQRSFALVDWADEEGARFSRSLFGSAAVVGTLDIAILRELKDRFGNSLPEVVAEHGVHIDALDGCRTRLANVVAYLELHIEQGPVLEHQGLGIGVVTGTVGIERERLTFTGQAAHAGTMPMSMRRDSLRAMSRFALELAEIGKTHSGVTTVGTVSCKPGVVTAVPGETVCTMDMRHIDAKALAAMFAEATATAHSAAAAEGCSVAFEHIFRIPPMIFDKNLVDSVRRAVKAVEGHEFELPSGALHDASEMARVVPTAMVFTNSIAGLSHTKEEDTTDEHLVMGLTAFHQAVLEAVNPG
ncbi:MAG: Zn-dependent hydrolase [Actinobacteria bacterium]|nr:Zn-dependent hydrolase [Actinomycetota bacterium]